jgi:flagellar biosynthetic protein FliP
MLSELRTAFQIGFVIFLPFLLIDLVVAAILMALGMIMLPPTTISLPLKLLLFLLVNGWALLAQALLSSYH